MKIDTVLNTLACCLSCYESDIHSYEVWDKVIFVRFYDRRPTFVSKSLFAKDSMLTLGHLDQAIRDNKPEEEIQRIKRHLYPAYLFRHYNWRDIVDEVRNAFGCCTWVFEGYTPKELYESIRWSESLNNWCRIKCITEEQAGLKKRLQKAGLLD